MDVCLWIFRRSDWSARKKTKQIFLAGQSEGLFWFQSKPAIVIRTDHLNLNRNLLIRPGYFNLNQRSFRSKPKIRVHFKLNQQSFQSKPDIRVHFKINPQSFQSKPDIRVHFKLNQPSFQSKPDIRVHFQ